MSPSQEQPFSADVLIIGAGLSGAVVARRLSEAGMSLLCLEQGDWHNRTAFRGEHNDWELTSLRQWHPNPNIRQNPGDYPIDDSRSDMKPMMFNGVGGSTILYGAQWMRFMPSDFRTRSIDSVGDDWPITYDDLAPYYDRIDRDFSVSGLNGDPAMPAQPPYPLPPLPIPPVGQRVKAGHEALGWHIWQGSNAIASRQDGSLARCLQLGVCGNGCPVGAEATTDITHWPAVQKSGGRILTGARVRTITHDRSGRANGAHFTLADGRDYRAKAAIVILAANAVGTPRILLSSKSSLFPDGLANGSGLVGKRLMMHPFSRAVGFFDEPLESWRGHWGQSVYSLEFAATRPGVGFVRGAKWNLGPSGGPLGAALFPLSDGPVWGAALHDRVAAWLGRTAVWGIICEDLPEMTNFVDLSPDRTDAFDNAVPRLHTDCRTIRRQCSPIISNAQKSPCSPPVPDTRFPSI